jgi:hypothetical protein
MIQCEGKVGSDRCHCDAEGIRHVYGQNYSVCAFHNEQPVAQLQLINEDLFTLYHSIHPRARRT